MKLGATGLYEATVERGVRTLRSACGYASPADPEKLNHAARNERAALGWG